MPLKNAHILTDIKKTAGEGERMSKNCPLADAWFEEIDAESQYISYLYGSWGIFNALQLCVVFAMYHPNNVEGGNDREQH